MLKLVWIGFFFHHKSSKCSWGLKGQNLSSGFNHGTMANNTLGGDTLMNVIRMWIDEMAEMAHHHQSTSERTGIQPSGVMPTWIGKQETHWHFLAGCTHWQGAGGYVVCILCMDLPGQHSAPQRFLCSAVGVCASAYSIPLIFTGLFGTVTCSELRE